jgi:hypothetical protein
LTTARAAARYAASSRADSQSSHRSCASRLEQVPSVIESPNATMAPGAVAVSVSIDLSQKVAVVSLVNAVFDSAAAASPPPFGVMYDRICALVCAAGCAAASGTYRLTARSSCAMTRIARGSLRTLPPAGMTTFAEPLKNSWAFEPATSVAPCDD